MDENIFKMEEKIKVKNHLKHETFRLMFVFTAVICDDDIVV